MDPAAQGWAGRLDAGEAPELVLSGILGSDEYYRRAGSTPRGFVQRLFRDVTGRAPSAREVSYWAGRMRFDTRDDVAYEVLTRYPPTYGKVTVERTYEYRRPYYPYRP